VPMWTSVILLMTCISFWFWILQALLKTFGLDLDAPTPVKDIWFGSRCSNPC